jgi:hypothetical protein
MAETSFPTPPTAAAWGNAGRGFAWVVCGVRLALREPALWIGMTLIYFLIALALKLIPFMGNFVLILITPFLLAGALLCAQASDKNGSTAGGSAMPAEPAWRRLVNDWLLRPARQLFQLLNNEEKIFIQIVVCILVLGLVITLSIPEMLITGGSIVSGLSYPGLAGPLKITKLIGIVVVLILYVLLAMSLYYVVPLTLFGGRQPIPAIAESFRTCVRHGLALAIFSAPFFAVNLAILSAFSVSRWLGLLLTFSVGLLALPAFVAGLYCSYKTLFESSPSAS